MRSAARSARRRSREYGHADGRRSSTAPRSSTSCRRRCVCGPATAISSRGAPGLRRRRDVGQCARRGDAGPDARPLRAAVSPGSGPHRQRHRHPRNFAFGVCGCRGDWTMASFVDESIGRIRAQVGDGPRGVRAVGRRRFDRRRRAAAQGHRRPAHVHLRRQRAAAAERGRAGAHAVRAAGPAARVRGRVGSVPRAAGRRHRSGAQAEDYRRDVHRCLRSSAPASSASSIFSRRARCIPT